MKQNLKIPVFHRSENQSSVGEITLQGKITSLDLSPGKYVTIIFHNRYFVKLHSKYESKIRTNCSDIDLMGNMRILLLCYQGCHKVL